MSKRFLIKLAGGVGLGSAALLLGTPAAALAAPYEASDRNSDRNGVVCATNEQTNEVIVASIFNDNSIRDSDVTFEQSTSVEATNDNRTQPNTVIVCIGEVDVDVDVED